MLVVSYSDDHGRYDVCYTPNSRPDVEGSASCRCRSCGCAAGDDSVANIIRTLLEGMISPSEPRASTDQSTVSERDSMEEVADATLNESLPSR